MSNPRNIAYPLQWPQGVPRTDIHRRERARFKCTVSSSLDALDRELKLMRAKNLILSSNYTLGDTNPKDPGVCAYFLLDDQSVAMPCDRWLKIEENVTAIAKTVEALRGIERWGSRAMLKAIFTGFKALPQSTSGLAWWDVLQVRPDASHDVVQENFRRLARQRHPDSNQGVDKGVAEVNQAWTDYQNQRKARA